MFSPVVPKLLQVRVNENVPAHLTMFLFALALSCLFTLIRLHLIISLCNVSALKVAHAFVKRKMCNTLNFSVSFGDCNGKWEKGKIS